MAFKVIVDTNVIKNERLETFLGGRVELKRFSQWTDIIIPEIVIEELKNHKKKHFLSERESFLKNIFHSLMQINKKKVKDFNFDKFIRKLQDKEDIPYIPINLTNYQVVEKMKELALENKPPFGKGKDGGFKDAYIYFTVLEYLEGIEDEEVFFLTQDTKLKEAFSNETRIIAIENFEEFQKKSFYHLQDDYFVERLQEQISQEITKKDIKDWWLNPLEENRILKISTEESHCVVKIDPTSREIIEIISIEDYVSFTEQIDSLIDSELLEDTHSCVEKIRNLIGYFTEKQTQNLIEAATKNNYISSIANEDDIKEFFLSLYVEPMPDIVLKETKERFEKIFSIIISNKQNT